MDDMHKTCRNCRHFQPVEQDIVDGLFLTNLKYEDGDCLLHGWEVTADYACEDFEFAAAGEGPAPRAPQA
jgi:hypothetical protein